jgi:hypothetical protein
MVEDLPSDKRNCESLRKGWRGLSEHAASLNRCQRPFREYGKVRFDVQGNCEKCDRCAMSATGQACRTLGTTATPLLTALHSLMRRYLLRQPHCCASVVILRLTFTNGCSAINYKSADYKRLKIAHQPPRRTASIIASSLSLYRNRNLPCASSPCQTLEVLWLWVKKTPPMRIARRKRNVD